MRKGVERARGSQEEAEELVKWVWQESPGAGEGPGNPGAPKEAGPKG